VFPGRLNPVAPRDTPGSGPKPQLVFWTPSGRVAGPGPAVPNSNVPLIFPPVAPSRLPTRLEYGTLAIRFLGLSSGSLPTFTPSHKDVAEYAESGTGTAWPSVMLK